MTLTGQMLRAFEQGQGPCFTCGAHAVGFVDEDGQPVQTLAPKPPIGVPLQSMWHDPHLPRRQPGMITVTVSNDLERVIADIAPPARQRHRHHRSLRPRPPRQLRRSGRRRDRCLRPDPCAP